MDLTNIFRTGKADAPAPAAELKTIDDVPAVAEAMTRLAACTLELESAEREWIKSQAQAAKAKHKFSDDFYDARNDAGKKFRLATHARDRARQEYETVREQAKTVAIAEAWPGYQLAVSELEQALDLAQTKNNTVMDIYEAASAMVGGTHSNSFPNLTFVPLNRSTKLVSESKLGAWKRYVRTYFTSRAA